MEAALERLDQRIVGGDGPGGAEKECAAAIGVPEGVRIGPRVVPRHLVAARDRFDTDRRPASELARRYRGASKLQYGSRAAPDRIEEVVVAARLNQACHPECFDDRHRSDHTSAV